MATTGELRAIVQELAIVVAEEITPMVLDTDAAVLEACKCTTCDLVHV